MAKVLVVDDTAAIRALITMNLQVIGHDVEQADDGLACLELIAGRVAEFDLVTLDWRMPQLDGLATYAQIRSMPGGADIPILMISTRSGPSDVAHCSRLGFDGFLGKPFSPRQLQTSVESLLAGRR